MFEHVLAWARLINVVRDFKTLAQALPHTQGNVVERCQHHSLHTEAAFATRPIPILVPARLCARHHYVLDLVGALAPGAGYPLGDRRYPPRSPANRPQPFWQRVRARAGLKDVRIHDLRHTFASTAVAAGQSLPVIGKLLGHTRVQTTARYAHLASATVKTAAGDVSAAIAASLNGQAA